MAKGNSFNALSLLNKKSQKQAEHERETIEEKKEEFDVVMLDVYDLVPSEDNFYSTKEIEELAVAIEILGGIRQNLEVKPPEHGKYEVTVGHRRRLASIRLVEEGKEKYRFVPCVIRKEETEVMDRLSLILTNSTARDMSDWEKVQQYKELKSALEEYRKQLEQEEKQARTENKCLCEFCEYYNADAEEESSCINETITEEEKTKYCSDCESGCPYYEKARFGRTREMISELLHLSGTQLSRYEKIDNSLKKDFKQELQEGNINVSVAHEIAKKTQEEQEELYEDYKQSGELHIKDVAKKEPQEIAVEQINNVRAVVQEIVKGEVNRAVFGNQNPAAVVNTLKRFFYQTYKGGKAEPENGEQVIYRFSTEGVNIMSKEWENYVVSYESLAEIIVAMIAAGELLLERESEPVQREMLNPQPKEEPTEEGKEEPQEETEDSDELPEQDNIMNHPEYLPDMEKGLSFSVWLERKEGIGQQDIIADIISREFIEVQTNSFSELQENIVGAVNKWLTTESEAYKQYMKG